MKVKPTTWDLTIIILVRLDSIDRLENTLAVTQFLVSNLDVSIKVFESAPFRNDILSRLLDKKIQYSFIIDNDPILFRTKLLNQISKSIDTKFIAIWDSDVIASIIQISKTMELLSKGEADFVYPYDKQFLDTSPILRKMYLQDSKIEILEQNSKKMMEMYPPNPLGGVFFANLQLYKEAGMENESFYGWGLEDGERFYRWESLGYKIKRIPGPLFHLSHSRGINSKFHNADQQLIKRKEISSLIRKMRINP